MKALHSWLSVLYPAMFIEDYKIICMSVKRFFTSIDPVYKKKYKFSESEIINDSILFIDEVDATKNEINDIIIESSLSSTVDLIPMVYRITSPFIHWEDNTPKDVKDLVPENDSQLKDIRKKALKIRNKYHDELPYYCPGIKNRNFLMSDSTFHASFDGLSKKRAYVYYDEEHNRMTIKIFDSEERKKELPKI